ncbi:MAG: hypothetical protein IJ064_05655 [Bacteroidaceae bacterium]|nr:hypothetical protein [Bacteroidaceae bacterium]
MSMADTGKCVVKIDVSSETNYFCVDDVVYYRSGMTADFVVRWLWYFEYLAALVKVSNPKRKVTFYKGPQDILLGKEWHEHRRQAMIKSRATRLKKLGKGVVDDDFFHFKSQDNEKAITEVKAQMAALERDEYPIADFPEYINKIKEYVV